MPGDEINICHGYVFRGRLRNSFFYLSVVSERWWVEHGAAAVTQLREKQIRKRLEIEICLSASSLKYFRGSSWMWSNLQREKHKEYFGLNKDPELLTWYPSREFFEKYGSLVKNNNKRKTFDVTDMDWNWIFRTCVREIKVNKNEWSNRYSRVLVLPVRQVI